MTRLIWIKSRAGGKGLRSREAQTIHDMIGSAGMLRGWVEVWSAHILLLLATLTVSVGAVALVELLTTHRQTARSAVVVASIQFEE
jgi:hypothetical protein